MGFIKGKEYLRIDTNEIVIFHVGTTFEFKFHPKNSMGWRENSLTPFATGRYWGIHHSNIAELPNNYTSSTMKHGKYYKSIAHGEKFYFQFDSLDGNNLYISGFATKATDFGWRKDGVRWCLSDNKDITEVTENEAKGIIESKVPENRMEHGKYYSSIYNLNNRYYFRFDYLEGNKLKVSGYRYNENQWEETDKNSVLWTLSDNKDITEVTENEAKGIIESKVPKIPTMEHGKYYTSICDGEKFYFQFDRLDGDDLHILGSSSRYNNFKWYSINGMWNLFDNRDIIEVSEHQAKVGDKDIFGRADAQKSTIDDYRYKEDVVNNLIPTMSKSLIHFGDD